MRLKNRDSLLKKIIPAPFSWIFDFLSSISYHASRIAKQNGHSEHTLQMADTF
jgi:hypothetical protein